MISLIIILILLLLFLLAMRGKPINDFGELEKAVYAHRGLHNETRPENSLSAFKAAVEKGYGIELDVHLLADGSLAVIHDTSLLRTCGVDINITTLKEADLKKYHLENTEETIPTFRQVLDIVGGKVPLIIELKTDGGNWAALSSAVNDALKDYQGSFCIESFDPRAIYWFAKHQKDIICGQLVDNFLVNKGELKLPLRVLLTLMVANFITRPSFIACNYNYLKMLPNLIATRLWGVKSVCWTIRNMEDFGSAVKNNSIPIFENIEP